MVKLFFSYSHKDEDLRNELEIHLAPLKNEGLISSWHDRRITAGRDLDQDISFELESSQVILLLISAHFLASKYCYEKEMARALERDKEGSAVVIPVILHPCDWQHSPFRHLRVTPTDGTPVSKYTNLQEAFAVVARDIRDAIKVLPAQKPPPKEKESRDNPGIQAPQEVRSSNLRIKRKFDDHERDEFLEDSYEYMARYFDGSLRELAARNPRIKVKFKRSTHTSFTASIYEGGERVAQCSIWYGEIGPSSRAIYYSYSGEIQRSSFNESFNVVDNGYALQLKPLGLAMHGNNQENALSQQGAAEYYWSLFIRHLQA